MSKVGISKEAKMLRPFNGKKKVSSTNGAGKTGYQHASWTLSYTIHKTSSRMYLRPISIKLLEEKLMIVDLAKIS